MFDRSLLTSATIALATSLATPAFASAAADAADASSDDGTIVVQGILAGQTISPATKSALPIAETPQSISIISLDELANRGVANLNQALRTVAGVTPETRGAAAELYDQFKLRGFDAPIYLDGLKQFASPTGYATPQVDISRLDSIAIVKGPASALYGQSSPGGLVGMTSKLPLDQSLYGSVAATYGSYNLYRVDADIGGKLSDAVGVRLYGSANGADTQQYYGSRARQTVSGAVTAKIDDATTLTVLGTYSHDPKNGNYSGAPASGTLFYNVHGKIDTRYADGEPGNFFRREQAAATYILERDFGGGWKFRSSGRYQRVTSNLGAIYETGLQAGLADITQQTISNRGSYATQERLDNWTFDNQLTGRIATGPVTHDILLGVDRQTAHAYELGAFGSANDLNIFAPVYGTQPVPQTPAQAGSPFVYAVSQRQSGLYGQDAMSWGGLRVLLSGRYDWAITRNSGTEQKDAQFTGRAGILYKTAFGLSPYASYATSFEPQSAALATGGLAKPSMGKQIEAGVKFQPNGSPILITAAWFHIEQTNVVTTNSVSFLASQSGKIRSEGFEIEANAPLPGGFNVHAAYSHQRVRNVADDDIRNIGGGLIGAGDGNLSVNLDWTAQSGPLKSLNIGVGMRHVDRVYAGVLDPTQTYTRTIDPVTFVGLYDPANYHQYYTPSYTLFDASLRYDLANLDERMKGIDLKINVTNMFDRKYLTSCYMYPDYDAWCWYGQRRTVQGTIRFSW